MESNEIQGRYNLRFVSELTFSALAVLVAFLLASHFTNLKMLDYSFISNTFFAVLLAAGPFVISMLRPFVKKFDSLENDYNKSLQKHIKLNRKIIFHRKRL